MNRQRYLTVETMRYVNVRNIALLSRTVRRRLYEAVLSKRIPVKNELDHQLLETSSVL